MLKDRPLEGQFPITKLALNKTIEFNLTKEDAWVKDLLVEMNEHATYKRPENLLPDTNLEIYGEMVKKYKSEQGEFLLVRGTIEAEYATECVKTLRPMKEKLLVDFNACFLDKSLAETEMFKDLDETFEDDEVYEIYFFERNLIDFQEMIHEQIYLHYNLYPTFDARGNTES